MEFWLSFNKGAERLRLPVNPDSVSVSSPFSYEDVNVSELGEFTIIGERGLKEFSFGSFFPRDYNPSYCEYNDIPDPQTCVDLIERWRDNRYPLRLTITGTSINYPVTIREFNYKPSPAGNPGDIYFDISFKEYRFLNLRTQTTVTTATSGVSQTKRPPSPKAQAAATPKNTTYVVQKGDSLWKIAASKMGSGDNWRKLYDANKSVIGKDPNKVKPGMKLVIPK